MKLATSIHSGSTVRRGSFGRILGFLVLSIIAMSMIQVRSQTLMLDLQSSNYSVATKGTVGGTWTDASPLANTAYSKTYYLSPGLKTSATPTGYSSVNFAYNGYFQQAASTPLHLSLSTPLTGASFTTAPSFTLEAVVKLTLGKNTNIFGGGDSGDLSWSIQTDGTQSLSKAAVSVVGNSTGTYTSDTWAVLAVTYSSGSYAFYMNGVQVGGGTSAQTFTTPTKSFIGSTYGDSNISTLEIADLKVYDGALTQSAISSEYSALASIYGVPEPSAWSLAMLGLLAVVCSLSKGSLLWTRNNQS